MDIKQAIKNHGGTISSVAKQLGITQSALSQQINNNSITLTKVEQIAAILHCSLPDFLAGNNDLIPLYCPYCGRPIYLHPSPAENPTETK